MNLAPSTIRTRTLLLKVFKETWPYGLTMKVRDVKSFMLRLWLAERRIARNLKSAGMNNYLRTLHGLFGLAVEIGAIGGGNIALEIKLIREPNPDRLTPTSPKSFASWATATKSPNVITSVSYQRNGWKSFGR